ncbi:MAG: hypothetical protein A2821_00840 [Candidatus Magasanikbacteria bacterium RIFCSPHIGHO2_01_FULL_41_23]|uniref:EamA domain-containing protein n=1 Tax=Candidatus Magasanikbacteria bacterium RIFCSPLOWO2_01_FULL_40_15 TaxID=1798686 RepID=A0A1F6N0F0_9BACT|nr:MAG: hypothetical protein A2821_00840 [Candidatus Magasanikbacteria bacterium RIFCSPHIGHO2_01_FULL_41_23]OGH74721.1 MAG: hypothetical protein A3F22_02195 [Candidatus Magasanikbacteria bacterium RIFCSPHIGHO2_12_FULL_41_16]OGH77435.1 MAG: hypothetical protein A2983_01895 [Candidatus Magasanikbacteria bacterium RIFCSPLOWO2_01_FULL_40_15]
MWILIALIGYALFAVVFILDKRILTNEKQSPIVYTFYSTVFLLLVGLAWFFIPFSFDPKFWLVSLISGFTFIVGLYTMFVAVSKSEASHIDPFIGAMITVTTFFLARFFLNEALTIRQMAGIGLLIVASVFLSFKKTPQNKTHWRWYAIGIVAGIFFGISNVSAKYLYDTFSFIPGLIGSRFAAGLGGLVLLLLPSVWKTFLPSAKKSAKVSTTKQPLGLVALDKVCGLIAILLLQWATALGSVTAVNALAGWQYALMFVIILVLSHRRSNFLREYLTKREIIVETAALVLVIIGLVLII